MKINYLNLAFACITLFFFSACGDEDVMPTPPIIELAKPNILLVIADDMGLDATPGYNIGAEKPSMPNLEKLTDQGLKFNNLWSYPVCTPTRGSIITGKYGFRTNIMQVDDPLSIDETSLQKYFEEQSLGYSTAVIGKWHLSKQDAHPNEVGVPYYAGLLSGGVQNYNNWSLSINGQSSNNQEYITSVFSDLAIDWIDDQSTPWFLWLAYNAPHTPFHLPPAGLHSQGILIDDQAAIDANPLPYYLAMIEAMDTEMGRVIASLSQEERDNTIIIFIGDNGSPGQVVQEYNNRRSKGSVYQGGVNVPLIVSGSGVTRIGQEENALINTTDLFATISNIAGSSDAQINDSKSFKSLLTEAETSLRSYAYTEVGRDNGTDDRAIRNATHKYILFDDGQEALFDLESNPLESPNLLNANQLPLSVENEAILVELKEKMDEIRE